MGKKYGTLTCKTCGKKIRYKLDPKYVKGDPNRLIAIRRHYARYHPRKWAQSIKRGVAKRKKGVRSNG